VQIGKLKHAAETLETHAQHVTQVVRILKKDKAIKVFKEASFDELAGLDEASESKAHVISVGPSGRIGVRRHGDFSYIDIKIGKDRVYLDHMGGGSGALSMDTSNKAQRHRLDILIAALKKAKKAIS
jgi:hypothetical protein